MSDFAGMRDRKDLQMYMCMFPVAGHPHNTLSIIDAAVCYHANCVIMELQARLAARVAAGVGCHGCRGRLLMQNFWASYRWVMSYSCFLKSAITYHNFDLVEF